MRTWSTEKPTREGWYWWKRKGQLDVVKLEWDDIEQSLVWYWDQHDSFDLLEGMDGEWCGPLEPPGEAKHASHADK